MSGTTAIVKARWYQKANDLSPWFVAFTKSVRMIIHIYKRKHVREILVNLPRKKSVVR